MGIICLCPNRHGAKVVDLPTDILYVLITVQFITNVTDFYLLSEEYVGIVYQNCIPNILMLFLPFNIFMMNKSLICVQIYWFLPKLFDFDQYICY